MNVSAIIPLYDEEELRKDMEKGRTPVFISWRTCSITRSHFKELKLFVEDNPEYCFYYFNDQLQETWMRKHFNGSPVYQAYLSAQFGAGKSDIFRYCLVLTFGGIFASINFLPTQPLSKFLPQPLQTFIVSPSSLPNGAIYARHEVTSPLKHGALAQFWICSVKNHPVLKIALELVINRYNYARGIEFKHVDQAIWYLTGPVLLNDAVNIYLDSEDAKMNSLTFLNEDFDLCVQRSKKSNYRYIFAPSYTGYKKNIVYKNS